MDLHGWGGEGGLGGSRGGEMVIRIDQNILYEISLFPTKNKRGERKGDKLQLPGMGSSSPVPWVRVS